jgi:hypothetical protein
MKKKVAASSTIRVAEPPKKRPRLETHRSRRHAIIGSAFCGLPKRHHEGDVGTIKSGQEIDVTTENIHVKL